MMTQTTCPEPLVRALAVLECQMDECEAAMARATLEMDRECRRSDYPDFDRYDDAYRAADRRLSDLTEQRADLLAEWGMGEAA